MTVVMTELNPTEVDKPEPQELQLAEPMSEEALHLSTLPISDMEGRVREGHTTLETLTEQLRDAQRLYNNKTHPSRHTSPEARAVALRDHLPALTAIEQQVRDAAATVRAAAQVIDEATGQDREPTLSDADMIRASAAREFVKENCDTLPINQLRSKVQHALQTRDPAQAWLYLRYGMQRLSDHREEDRHSAQDAESLRSLLASVQDRMSDKRGRETNARAKALRLAAAQLEGRTKARTAAVYQAGMESRLRSHF